MAGIAYDGARLREDVRKAMAEPLAPEINRLAAEQEKERERAKKIEQALRELVDKAEALLLNSVGCLKRHAKSEAGQCPACVADVRTREALTKAKEVLPKEPSPPDAAPGRGEQTERRS